MPTEPKIDHAAEARRTAGLAHNNQNQENYPLAAVQLQRAQVHATLALVEQQRIANLLALPQVPIGEIRERIATAPEEARNIWAVIFEGLGL